MGAEVFCAGAGLAAAPPATRMSTVRVAVWPSAALAVRVNSASARASMARLPSAGTVPMAGLMVTSVAPGTDQRSVTRCPAATGFGEAAKGAAAFFISISTCSGLGAGLTICDGDTCAAMGPGSGRGGWGLNRSQPPISNTTAPRAPSTILPGQVLNRTASPVGGFRAGGGTWYSGAGACGGGRYGG